MGRIRALVPAVAVAVMAGAVGACSEVAPTPVAPALVLAVEEPVVARFVPETGILSAEFPVSISDPTGPGGSLVFVEVLVVNRTRGVVLARNRRPNTTYAYSDVHVPSGGRLTVAAAVGFSPPPPRDHVVLAVRAGLTDGREVERTAAVELRF